MKIVCAAIPPAIGIARVGNSPEDYFLGPETLVPLRMPVGFYKDNAGAHKRQAARFRVYGHNAAGEVVRELTADNADLRWKVHLANQKRLGINSNWRSTSRRPMPRTWIQPGAVIKP